jgi:hypothetical protein
VQGETSLEEVPTRTSSSLPQWPDAEEKPAGFG